jgi:hypothetical protein
MNESDKEAYVGNKATFPNHGPCQCRVLHYYCQFIELRCQFIGLYRPMNGMIVNSWDDRLQSSTARL